MVSADRVGHSAGYWSVYRAGGAAAICGKISGSDFPKSDAPAARIGSGRYPVCFPLEGIDDLVRLKQLCCWLD